MKKLILLLFFTNLLFCQTSKKEIESALENLEKEKEKLESELKIKENEERVEKVYERFVEYEVISKNEYFLTTHPNGKVIERGILKDGKKHGLITKFSYIDGRILSQEYYKDGYLNGVTILYNENGTVKSLITFDEGVLDGFYFDFTDDGKPNQAGFYEDNAKDGEWIRFWTFDEQRGIADIANFRNDELNGISTRYSTGITGIYDIRSMNKDGEMVFYNRANPDYTMPKSAKTLYEWENKKGKKVRGSKEEYNRGNPWGDKIN